MRKRIFVILAVVMVIIFTTTTIASADLFDIPSNLKEGAVVTCINQGVKLRSTPEAIDNGNVLLSLKRNDRLFFIKWENDSWIYVKYNNDISGYCYSNYFKYEAASLPSVEPSPSAMPSASATLKPSSTASPSPATSPVNIPTPSPTPVNTTNETSPSPAITSEINKVAPPPYSKDYKSGWDQMDIIHKILKIPVWFFIIILVIVIFLIVYIIIRIARKNK